MNKYIHKKAKTISDLSIVELCFDIKWFQNLEHMVYNTK